MNTLIDQPEHLAVLSALVEELQGGVQEAASETQGKKVGRPRLWPESEMEAARKVGKPGATDRTVRDYIRIKAAMMMLDWDFPWLCDKADLKNMKFSIMAQLGYFSRTEARQLAEVLCRDKPTTKRAVAWLRSLRKPKQDVDVDKVRGDLLKLLNRYMAEHPGVTIDHLAEALAGTTLFDSE